MKTIFQKILVPYDFSPSAAEALAVAVELAVKHGGALLVVHAMAPVFPLHGAPLLPTPSEIAAVGRGLEERVAAAVKGRRVRTVKSRVMVGQPYVCILEAARKADAIVMGTLGRTGLSHLLLGSVAERVVRHAPVPVLTVRAAPGRKR